MSPENQKNTAYPVTYLPISLIICLPILIYLNSLSNQFVYDDETILATNYFVKTLSNLPNLFNANYFKSSGELSYRPVTTASYFFDYTVWKLLPFGFHLTNLILHTINVALSFFLFNRIFKDKTTAFLCTLIFLCHPVLSETVNAIGYRDDLLAATFSLAAFLLYIKTRENSSPFPYFASVICFLLGIFSKEMAITLPFLIFLYDVTLAKNIQLKYKFTRYYSGYIGAILFYILVRFVLLRNPMETHVSYPNNSIVENIFIMPKVFASYIKLLFIPANLSADYVVPYFSSHTGISTLLSILFLSAFTIIVGKSFYYSRTVFYSLIWFLATLLPVLNIIPIENIMADRYLYLPSLGFCMITGHFIKNCHRKLRFIRRPYCTLSIAISLFIAFSIITIKRNTTWFNNTALWANTAKTTPASFRAHNNIGNHYRETGMLDESIREFKYALTLNTGYIQAHNNLGITYEKKGLIKEAIEEYKAALKINPSYPFPHNNLGLIYAKANLLDTAIDEFKKAIHNKPDYSEALNNIGVTYIRKGLNEEAITALINAVKYDNRNVDAYYNLSVAYFQNGQPDKALETTENVLALNPNHKEIHTLLGLIHEERR
ncbi:MAG: tetratricopeptide repeat protein [Planctomycetes bacterium]|nr:tetratricopeptide repeat protein [Planctomycetota bacterium]MBM4064172.1 tetratricopeptide repeat protein [Planctomycetota bacterium]